MGKQQSQGKIDNKEFITKFYQKYAPAEKIDSDRLQRLSNSLSQDFDGTISKMYGKYDAGNVPTGDRLQRLKNTYGVEVGGEIKKKETTTVGSKPLSEPSKPETQMEKNFRLAFEQGSKNIELDPVKAETNRYFQGVEQQKIADSQKEKLATDKTYYSEHFNKKIESDVKNYNKQATLEGKKPISVESELKFREEKYANEFLTDDIDKESYNIKLNVNKLDKDIANIDVAMSKEPALQSLTDEQKKTVRNAQLNKLKVERDALSKKGATFEENRIKDIDKKINELSVEMMNQGVMSSDKSVLAERIKLLSSQKQNFFKDINENTKDLVTRSGGNISNEPSDKKTFDKYYDAMYQEYRELMEEPEVKSALGERGLILQGLNAIGVTSTGTNERFVELNQLLKEYAPIRLLNRYTTGQTESLGFVASEGDWFEGAKRVGGEFMRGLSNISTPVTQKSQLEKTQSLAGEMQGLGIGLNENVKTSARIDEKGNFGEYGLDEPEYWANLAGTSAGLGVMMAGAKGTGIGLKADKALNASRYLTALSKTPTLGKLLKPSVVKGISTAISAGVEYKSAGLVFQNAKEELTFTAGMYGSAGSQLVGGFLKKSSTVFSNKFSKYFSNDGLNKLQGATINYGKNIAGRAGAGVGEVAEEFSQEIASIHADDNVEFFKELDNRFGTFKKSSKFVISSYVMGYVMGGGTNVNKVSQESFNKEMERLKEIDPIEAEKVQKVIDDINTDIKETVGKLGAKRNATSEEAPAHGVKETDPTVSENVPIGEKLLQKKSLSFTSATDDVYKGTSDNNDIDEVGNSDNKILAESIFKNKVEEADDFFGVTREEKVDFINKNESRITDQTVNVNDIIPTQELLDNSAIQKRGSGIEPVIVKFQGKYFILDGHHRIASDINGGKTDIKAKVIDFDTKEQPKAETNVNTRTVEEIEADRKTELELKNEGKADTPTQESVTERLNVNNPFYKKVEDALVKEGIKAEPTKEPINRRGEVDTEKYSELASEKELTTEKKQDAEINGLLNEYHQMNLRERKSSAGAKLRNRIKVLGKEYGLEVNDSNVIKGTKIFVTRDGKKIKSYNSTTPTNRDVDYKSPKERNFSPKTNRVLDVFINNFESFKGVELGFPFSKDDLKGIVSDLKSGKPTLRATRLLNEIAKIGEYEEVGYVEWAVNNSESIRYGISIDEFLKMHEKESDYEINKIIERSILEGNESWGMVNEPITEEDLESLVGSIPIEILEEIKKEKEYERARENQAKSTESGRVEGNDNKGEVKTVGERETKTEPKQEGIGKDKGDGGGKPPIEKEQAPKGSSSTAKKKFFLSMLDQIDIPEKVKEDLRNNIKRAVISNKEALKIAKEYISRFDSPKEAFDSVQDFGSELLQASVGVEALNMLREEQTKLQESGASVTEIVEKQAEIYEVIEQMQDQSADRGRAIQILTKAMHSTSEEALALITKRKIAKMNESQMERQNVSEISNTDIEEITKSVLASEEIQKLKSEIEQLKKKLDSDTKDNPVIKKERAKIKQHKQNINDILQKYKDNKGKIASATIIPGITSKETQLIFDLAKEYIAMLGSDMKIVSEQIKELLKDQLNKDVDAHEIEKAITENYLNEKKISKLEKISEESQSDKKKAIALEFNINELFEDILLGKKDSDAIKNLLVDLGIDSNKATKMASSITENLTKKLKTSIENKVNKKLEPSSVPNKKKTAKNVAEKIVIGHKAGVDLNKLIKSLYNEEIGVLDMNNDVFIETLSKHITKIFKAPLNSKMRNEAESVMMDWINTHQKANYGSILKSLYYANMLSSYNTHINNIGFGVMAVAKEYVNNAVMGIFKEDRRLANKELIKSFNTSWAIAREVYKTGIGGEIKYETESEKSGKMQRPNSFAKSYIGGRFFWGYLNGVLKALSSQDNFFTNIITSGQVVKELYSEALRAEMDNYPDGNVPNARRKELLDNLKTKFNDIGRVENAKKQANKEVSDVYELEDPLMIEENGFMKLNPIHDSMPTAQKNKIIRDYKIRTHEIRQDSIDEKGDASLKAFDYAKDIILSGKPTGTAGIIYQKLNHALGDMPVVQFLTIPFIKVPVNSSRLIVDTTPVLGAVWHGAKLMGKMKNKFYKDSANAISESTIGLFMSQESLDKLGIRGDVSDIRSKQIIKRQVISTVVAGAILSVMSSDDEDEDGIKSIIDFTAGLKDDWKENETLKNAKGLEPYTVYVNGESIGSYIYSPFAGVLNYIGTVRDSERGLNEFNEGGAMAKYLLSSRTGATLALEQSALTGVSKLTDTFSRVFNVLTGKEKEGDELIIDKESKGSKIGHILAKELFKNMQTLVPGSGLIKTVNADFKAIFDMPNKEAITAVDYIIRGYPMVENILEDKKDFLGRKIVGDVDLGSLRLGAESKYEYALMNEVGFDITNNHFYNIRVIKNPVTDETVELSKEQLYMLNEYIKRERVENFTFSEWVEEYDGDDDRNEMIKKQMDKAHNKSNKDGIWEFFEKEYK